MITIKRAYEKAAAADGARILVDRVWPRGVTKEALQADMWLKDAAPSTELRKWFGHDPERWKEFQRRYHAELSDNVDAWKPILAVARKKHVTLLYGARDEEHNNAVALQAYLKKRR